MQPNVSVNMPLDLARRHTTYLQAMIRAFDTMSAEKAREGDVRNAMKLAQNSEECSLILEALEGGIAHRPLPLYVFDEAMVVRE